MNNIKLIVEIESDGFTTNVLVDGEEADSGKLPYSLKEAIEEWNPADIMAAIYLAENE